MGGEFICGTKESLQQLCAKIDDVYELLKKDGFRQISSDAGDEALLSIAVANMTSENVHDGGGYIERFWTGTFYRASTNWKYDSVLIWHLPAEKNYGMLTLYRSILEKQAFPTIERMAVICSLPKERCRITRYSAAKFVCKLVEKIRRENSGKSEKSDKKE